MCIICILYTWYDNMTSLRIFIHPHVIYIHPKACHQWRVSLILLAILVSEILHLQRNIWLYIHLYNTYFTLLLRMYLVLKNGKILKGQDTWRYYYYFFIWPEFCNQGGQISPPVGNQMSIRSWTVCLNLSIWFHLVLLLNTNIIWVIYKFPSNWCW